MVFKDRDRALREFRILGKAAILMMDKWVTLCSSQLPFRAAERLSFELDRHLAASRNLLRKMSVFCLFLHHSGVQIENKSRTRLYFKNVSNRNLAFK